MGMLFGGWAREEEEDYQFEFEKSGISRKDWDDKKKYERDNKNLSYYKKIARFRGVELNEFDMICKDVNSERYVINDFQEDGRPICTLVTNEKHEFYNKPYPYDSLFVIKSIFV